jgi:hypothetical protein
MKKIVSVCVFLSMMLIAAAGCAPGTFPPFSTPLPGAKTATPAPNGQINVPGVSLQLYAPGPNPMVNTADAHGSAAGILLGIWHGVISPVTLVLSFFNTGAQMYEVHNDGSQYNLGFLLGAALVFILLGILGGSRRR